LEMRQTNYDALLGLSQEEEQKGGIRGFPCFLGGDVLDVLYRCGTVDNHLGLNLDSPTCLVRTTYTIKYVREYVDINLLLTGIN
jgi:hypothetical protein